MGPPVLRDAGEDATDVYLVGVRESTDPQSWTLLFMECLDAQDGQEIELGMDTYCLVVDPGQATSYGGVIDYRIDRETLRLTLTDQAAEALGMPVQTAFALDLTPPQIDILERGLIRVLTSGRAEVIPRALRA